MKKKSVLRRKLQLALGAAILASLVVGAVSCPLARHENVTNCPALGQQVSAC